MEEKDFSQKSYSFIQALQLMRNSSVPAISQLGSSSSKSRKIFWIIVLIVSILGCVREIHQWLNVYFMYPVVINMEIETPLRMEFPAVTVCNLNRAKSQFETQIKQGKMHQSGMARTLFVSEIWDTVLSIPKSESQRKLQEEKINFMQKYSEFNDIFRRYYGYGYSEMIKRCSFGGVSCGISNFTLFQDKQYGNCYTFRSPNQSSTFLHRPGPDYGLEIEIDALEDTYLDITPNLGFIVAIHNRAEDPVLAANGINLSPGYEIHLAITKTSVKRLPPPYRDKCFNYNSSATDAFLRSESVCIQMCMQNISFSTCLCVDPSLPALKHMNKCNLENTTEMSCLKEVLEQMHDHGLPCSCPLPCVSTSYDIQLTSSLWYPFSSKNSLLVSDHWTHLFKNNSGNFSYECKNTKEYIHDVCDIQSNKDLSKNNININKLLPKHQKKSFLKIFFKNFEHKIYTQEPAFTEAELYAHLGGHLNFWLGLSIVAIFECLQSFVFFLKFLMNK